MRLRAIGAIFCAVCVCALTMAILYGRLRLVSSFEYLLTSPKIVDAGEEGIFINGSFAAFEQKRWMAVRKMEGEHSFIYLGNEEGGQLQNPIKLNLDSLYAEDPRLFVFGNQLVIVYNDFVGPFRRVHLAFLCQTSSGWAVEKKQPLFIEGKMQDSEKNWVPFVHEDKLYFIYQTSPWTILEWQPTGLCTIFSQKDLFIPGDTANLRGGTPALRSGDEYISFFHTRNGATRSYLSWNRNIYLMGAYTFDAHPPFDLKKVTTTPLAYPGAYNLFTNFRKTLYPTGLIVTPEAFYLSLGVNDDRTEIAVIDKGALASALSGSAQLQRDPYYASASSDPR